MFRRAHPARARRRSLSSPRHVARSAQAAALIAELEGDAEPPEPSYDFGLRDRIRSATTADELKAAQRELKGLSDSSLMQPADVQAVLKLFVSRAKELDLTEVLASDPGGQSDDDDDDSDDDESLAHAARIEAEQRAAELEAMLAKESDTEVAERQVRALLRSTLLLP